MEDSILGCGGGPLGRKCGNCIGQPFGPGVWNSNNKLGRSISGTNTVEVTGRNNPECREGLIA